MKLKIILLGLLLFSVGDAYSFLGNKRYVVVTEQASLYKNFIGDEKVGTINLGTALQAMTVKDLRVQFRFGHQDIWINQKDLLPLNITARKFSESSVLYADSPIINNDMWFVFKNRLYQMNLTNPRDPVISFQTEIPAFAQWELSPNRETALLIGDGLQKENLSQNLALFRIKDREFIPLTFIYDNKAVLHTAYFSPDSRYLALFMEEVDKKNYLLVYETSTGSLAMQFDDILSYTWFDSELVLFKKNEIALYDYSKGDWAKSVNLYSYKKEINQAPDMAVKNNKLFIQIGSKIYQLQNQQLEETRFNSVVHSDSGNLQLNETDKEIIVTYKGKRLRSFSGKTPRRNVLQLIGDDLIQYQYKEGPLQNLSLYNAELDESYAYYWVETPQHVLSDGISIESVIDRDTVLILIEKPSEWLKSLNLNDLLQ